MKLNFEIREIHEREKKMGRTFFMHSYVYLSWSGLPCRCIWPKVYMCRPIQTETKHCVIFARDYDIFMCTLTSSFYWIFQFQQYHSGERFLIQFPYFDDIDICKICKVIISIAYGFSFHDPIKFLPTNIFRQIWASMYVCDVWLCAILNSILH